MSETVIALRALRRLYALVEERSPVEGENLFDDGLLFGLSTAQAVLMDAIDGIESPEAYLN